VLFQQGQGIGAEPSHQPGIALQPRRTDHRLHVSQGKKIVSSDQERSGVSLYWNEMQMSSIRCPDLLPVLAASAALLSVACSGGDGDRIADSAPIARAQAGDIKFAVAEDYPSSTVTYN